jgi:hypothetical protein
VRAIDLLERNIFGNVLSRPAVLERRIQGTGGSSLMAVGMSSLATRCLLTFLKSSSQKGIKAWLHASHTSQSSLPAPTVKFLGVGVKVWVNPKNPYFS